MLDAGILQMVVRRAGMGVLDAEILTDGAGDGNQEGWDSRDGPAKVH